MSELTVKSAAEQIQLLQGRCLSAEELALEYLREIARLNPRLHAYVDLDENRALSAARDADKRSWSIEGVTVEYFDAMRFTQWFNVLGLRRR
jgi:Asp-tRNA(Asn)/Glu-tRNA(Gln) amidotransferase A subunit family amidase